MRTLLAIAFALTAASTMAGSLDPAGGARAFPLEALQRECIAFASIRTGQGDASDCRVSEFGSLGTMGGREYYYALYCLAASAGLPQRHCDSTHGARAVAIFVEDASPGYARLWIERAAADIDGFVYERPQIFSGAMGTFLYVPVRLEAMTAGDESEYYLWENAQWQRVDGSSWFEELREGVASRLSFDRGLGVHRPDDHSPVLGQRITHNR